MGDSDTDKRDETPKILPHGILFSGHDNSTDKDIPSTISRKVETIDLAQEPGLDFFTGRGGIPFQ